MKIEIKKNTRFAFPLGMILSSVLALLYGFLVPTKEQMTEWLHTTGYYFIFATTILWLLSMLPESLERKRLNYFIKNHGGALIVAVILVVGMYLSCPPQFRILADETNLAAIAASMYQEHTFYNSTSGLYYYDAYHDFKHVWGIRPLFFPFLINIIHTISGYSAENGFVVNAIAGTITLWLFYGILQCWFPKSLALAGMILLASFPVFVLWVTSGGFEIVNLLFAMLSFFLFDKFLKTKKGIDLERLGLTLVLLSQLRYESAIFTICFAIIYIILFIRNDDYKNYTYKIIFIPFLFLPVAWHRMATMSSEVMLIIKDDHSLFSFTNFSLKFLELIEYFSSNTYKHNTIPILFYLGLFGILYGIWMAIKHKEVRTVQNTSLIAYTTLNPILLIIIILTYNLPQGGISHPTTIRYGIIFLPLIIFGIIFLTYKISYLWNTTNYYFLFFSIGILLFYWPVAVNNDSVNTLLLTREYNITLNYLKKNYSDKNIIIVSDRPGLYTPHKWGAVHFSYANQKKEELLRKFNRKLTQEILVIQKIQYLNEQPTPETRLIEQYHLEKLFEMQISGNSYLRISRVLL